MLGASANAPPWIAHCCSWTAPGRGSDGGARVRRAATVRVPRHTDSEEGSADELSRPGGRGCVLEAFEPDGCAEHRPCQAAGSLDVGRADVAAATRPGVHPPPPP